MKKYSIGIIGAGTMGKAIAKSLISNGKYNTKSISLFDINKKRVEKIKKTLKTNLAKSLENLTKKSKVIILAVKPQDSKRVLTDLKNLLKKNHIILSIMAGISIKTIKKYTNHNKVVRVMPNMAAQIGKSISVWSTTSSVKSNEKSQIKNILQCFGKEIKVNKEIIIDKATAISGSGPAYVFFFAENLMNAAQKLGISHNNAKVLIEETLIGASHLLKETGQSPRTLRKNVTSKGGTTEAAFKKLTSKKLDKIWVQAIKAAYERAVEIRKRYE